MTGRLNKYFHMAIATLFVVCANETAKVSQEDVCVAQSDSLAVSGVDAVTLASGVSISTNKQAGATELKRPRITLQVTPTDSASVSLMGATLVVPTGAVEQELTLSITALGFAGLAKLPQGMVNVTRNAAGFRFLPHGRHFSGKDARITLPVDTLAIPHGYTHKDVFVYYYDEERKSWTALPRDTASLGREMVCALTGHFTDMIAGVMQVPEMPGTQGFVPTAMSDIKAADPTSGIISVQAPQAVQNGAATLSYPIVTPQGRNGMQPSLALTYCSEGRSGWCGYGWRLQTPSIDIDTRWGVPRFDKKYETEIYLINGEQTTLQPHRSPESIERADNREFFPRVESIYSKIVRKGDSPGSYSWEITTKDGTVYEYNDVVKNDDGNIVHWSLSKATEPHGDNITYSYKEVNGYLYLSEIHYTNHGDTQGNYSVKITLAEDSKNIRRDVTTSFRLGFLQADGEQLGEIAVYYKDELFARYVPTYENGALRKTTLTSITQYDGDGKEVGTNSFDYYNEVMNGLFGEAEMWDGKVERFQTSVLGKNLDYVNAYSSIGGGGCESASWGGGINVGSGFGSNVLSVHAGYSAAWNRSTSEATITLVDIDGDGLLDKVFALEGTLCYRPNLSARGKLGFGEIRKAHGLPDGSLLRSKVEGFSWSVNGGVGINIGGKNGGVGGGVSYDEGTTRSCDVIYMHDFNGDGLVDISRNGTVYFNHIGDNGEPYFSVSSYDTDVPIVGKPDNSLLADYEENADSLRAEQEKNNPLRDAVRMWRAPYSGRIKISGTIRLETDNDTWYNYDGEADGVKVSIQLNDDEIWTDQVLRPSKSVSYGKSINIEKGDCLFFRTRSIYSGALDAVSWCPIVTYASKKDDCPSADENGLSTTTFNAQEDFLHTGASTILLSGPCSAMFTMPVSKKALRGSLVLSVDTEQNDGTLSSFWGKTLRPDEVLTEAETKGLYTKMVDIAAGDTLSFVFSIKSDAPLDWSGVMWKPAVAVRTGNDITTLYAAPDIVEMYNKPISVKSAQTLPVSISEDAKTAVDTTYETGKADKNWTLSSSLPTITEYADELSTQVNLSIGEYTNDSTSSAMLIVLADADSVFYVQRSTVSNKDFSSGNFSIPATKLGKPLAANVYLGSEVESIRTARVSFARDVYEHHEDTYIEKNDKGEEVTRTVKWTVHSIAKVGDIDAGVSSKFGHTDLGVMYRGWGQFAWDGGQDGITTADLQYKADDYKGLNQETLQDKDAVSGLSAGRPLKTMAYDAERQRWRGENDSIYVCADGQKPSRMGEEEIKVELAEHPGGEWTLASVNTYTKSISDGKSVNGKLSVGLLGANRGQSRSESKTTTQVSVMDINGDRFPDWLYASGDEMTVNVTNMLGRVGAGQFAMPNGLNATEGKAKSTSKGASLSTIDGEDESGDSKSKAPSKNSKSTGAAGLKDCSVGLASASEGAVGLSGSYSTSEDETTRDMIDINGDGLPDIVYSDGSVRFGKGFAFTDKTNYGQEALRQSSSRNKASGGGVSIPIVGYASVGFGTNNTSSDNVDNFVLQDVDGDGLPDKISGSRVAFNNGRGFDDYVELGIAASASTSVSSNKYANSAVPIRIGPMFGFSVYVTPCVTGSKSESFSRTEHQLIDIDGDGYVDMVEAGEGGNILVRKNKVGKTNLLRNVTSPLGATTTIDYNRTGNTYDQPQSRWVMSKVTTNGGDRRNGATRFATAFEYKNGYYDRRERDFFGFGEVKSTQLDTENGDAPYRATVQVYDNRTYETRNLVTEATTATAEGDLLSKTENAYTKRSVHDGKSLFVAPSATKTTTYEGTESISISESYAYDERGNLIGYTSATPTDSYTTEIKYHALVEKNIYTRPSDVRVSIDGKTLRHATSQVNANGDLTRISQHADGVTASFDMERDEYGNVTKLTHPQNANGQRFFCAYTYDNTHHALVTRVEDAFGYSLSTDYDLKWCVPTKQTDINGCEMRYTYDNRGRQTSASAPYEIEAGGQATISIEYDDKRYSTTTTNYDSKTKNAIKVCVFTDNLGRAIQTKKSGVVDGKETMIVSGVIEFDAFGRKVAEGQPTTDNTVSLNTGDILNPTLTEYDSQDRPTKVILPDGTASTAEYSIVENLLKSVQTDANGHATDIYKDVRGKGRKTVRHADGQEIATEFNYNAIGELLSVIHPNNEVTTYRYDGLGRKLSVSHPDAGLTTFEYDAAGNLTSKQTANLRAVDPNGKIQYTYDYERLSEIVYPKNIYNRVTYTYGDTSETKYNRAGRLKLVEDGSGGEAYYYGKLGEVTKTVKSVILSETDIRTYIWEADYDSWGRINTMTYPDGEVVSYTYDKGGNLSSITTDKKGDKQTLIAEQCYDKYGNLTYRRLGNGTETKYDYDEKRLHMNTMSLMGDGVKMMENVYRYDNVDNILGISNSVVSCGEIGGTYSHSYQYDEQNRLVKANGTAKDKSFELLMRYDVMGNPLQKDSVTYEYNTTNHPNAGSCAGSKIFRYDANGNPISEEDTTSNAQRVMQWDEENRLQSLGDDGYVSRYTYNHAGERVVKSHGPTTVAFVNGAPQGVLWHDKDNWTMYVSPYMVVSADRFTKHYYAGGQRVASKIGVGEFNNLYDASKACVTAGQKDYAERVNLITQSRNDYYAALGIPPRTANGEGHLRRGGKLWFVWRLRKPSRQL